jgi:hypothetical protein
MIQVAAVRTTLLFPDLVCTFGDPAFFSYLHVVFSPSLLCGH